MFLTININEYNSENIYYCEPIKNTVLTEGKFIRILYAVYDMTLNGIYNTITFTDGTGHMYYNKQKYIFDINKNNMVIDKLIHFENELLKKYDTTKTPVYNLKQQLLSGSIRIFNDSTEEYRQNQHQPLKHHQKNKIPCSNDHMKKNNSNHSNGLYILKVAGIWEDKTTYGITYKFNQPNHQYDRL
jgi:hypothetical protein|tara:strand:- start:421 stop:978 length:558 start_codon:yes stop_codon:yes gene_type:complete